MIIKSIQINDVYKIFPPVRVFDRYILVIQLLTHRTKGPRTYMNNHGMHACISSGAVGIMML